MAQKKLRKVRQRAMMLRVCLSFDDGEAFSVPQYNEKWISLMGSRWYPGNRAIGSLLRLFGYKSDNGFFTTDWSREKLLQKKREYEDAASKGFYDWHEGRKGQ